MDTLKTDADADGSSPKIVGQDQQAEPNETGATEKHKPWEFKVRSEFIQGTTHRLRGRWKKTIPLSFEARCLFIYLSSFASKKSPQPFPAMKMIMFDTGWGVSTIQKYRRELERAGYVKRHQVKKEGRYSSNLYTLIYSPESRATKQSIEKQSTETQSAGFQSADSKPTKRYQCTERGSSADSEDRHEVPEPGSSRNTPPSARGADAAESTPSATQSGDTPEPPVSEQGPRSKAEGFIKAFKHWGKAAHLPATVIPREREALVRFFTDNPEVSQEELTAMMLCAWMVPHDLKAEGTDFNPFWHCQFKSKRILSFVEHIPDIQQELEWRSKLTAKQYRLAQEHFDKTTS